MEENLIDDGNRLFYAATAWGIQIPVGQYSIQRFVTIQRYPVNILCEKTTAIIASFSQYLSGF